jgi:acyl dehydratase
MRTISGIDELKSLVGEHLGTSDWHVIGQDRIDGFAEATGDHQWIHVDPEKAAQGPFGTTIAHGFLTLSLIPMLNWEAYTVEGVRMGVNYGLNKVRFTAPVPVGSRVRASTELAEATEIDGGVQIVCRVTVELEGSEKPACIAETVSRMYV